MNQKTKKKAVVLAYHNMGCAGIKALLGSGYEIVAIFTYADDPGEVIWFDSVAELAIEKGIPSYSPDDINHPIWVAKIQEMQPDFLFSFYYRDIVKQEILDIPRDGCLNLHGSMLPRYRGRAPVNWVLINGEKETGVTLHYMIEQADAGDIVSQQSVDIEENDTAQSLNNRMVEAATEMLEKCLPALSAGQLTAAPQNDAKASYFGGRTAADGRIDWNQSSERICNLVRAVTRPYPGAFAYRSQKKFTIWSAHHTSPADETKVPGTILSVKPLTVACGTGAIVIETGQVENGLLKTGESLADDLSLVPGVRLNSTIPEKTNIARKTRVLILGVNGFIGNALTEKLLENGNYEVHGMDLNDNSIQRFCGNPDFFFYEGDISISREWIELHVRKCDVILPLVAIATPIEYTRNPLRVFELDFEENLHVVRYCVKYGKRIIFPSTSEVYGMCEDPVFDEDTSRLVLGPISKQRWIYSCSKQLMDRIIWAYGQSEGLNFTLFRPFNWVGPRLDTLDSARIGSSRVITQLILNLVEGTPIQLIDGGNQKRCFTDVGDGIECLFRIIENKKNACNGKIINIGNPDNEASIRQLAEVLTELFESHPLRSLFPPLSGMTITESREYYGEGYEDVQHRKPSIKNASRILGWSPKISMEESVRTTLDFFLREYVASNQSTIDNSLPKCLNSGIL